MTTKTFHCTTGGTANKPHLNPPTQCDLCKAPIVEQFYDANLPKAGWANVCPDCFKLYNGKLGVGFGQEFTAC